MFLQLLLNFTAFIYLNASIHNIVKCNTRVWIGSES